MAEDEERQRPANFVHAAALNIFEEIWTDCYDRVAARVNGFQRFHCIAMPDGFPGLRLTCGESALRLAISLVHWQTRDPNGFSWRVGNVTLPQMRRALQRNGLKDFPIYLAAPPLDVDEDRPLILTRGSKHRKDNWSIIYIPDGPGGRPHWTFAKIPPPEEPEVAMRHAACLVYTDAPHEPQPGQFWRAVVTKDNMAAFLAAKAQERACSCPLEKCCEHERVFLQNNNAAVCLSLLTDRYILGSFRCQVGKCNKAERLPDNGVRIHHAEENVDIGHSYGCTAILDIGKNCSPYSMLLSALCPRPLEPWLVEHESLEIPQEVRETNFGGIPVTAYKYEPRFGLFNAVQISGCLGVGIVSLLGAGRSLYKAVAGVSGAVSEVMHVKGRVIPEPRYYQLSAPEQWAKFAKSKFECLSNLVCLPTLPDLSPQVPIPTPHTRMERVYETAYTWLREALYVMRRSVTKVSPRIYTTAKLSASLGCFAVGAYLVYVGCKALSFRLGKTRVVPVVAQPRRERYGRLDDLGWNVPSLDELQSRLAALPNVTKDHAYDILRRIAAMENWHVRWNRAEVMTWIERVVTVPGETRLLEDQPKNKCLNCKLLPMKYRMLCKICWTKLRKLPAPERYIPDEFLVYVGVLPIYSSEFKFQPSKLKNTAEVTKHGKIVFNSHSDPVEMTDWYAKQHVTTGYRGRSCGPVFMGQRPTCFPRGSETAVVAFLVRLGGESPCQAIAIWYDRLYDYFSAEPFEIIEPESRNKFLKHFKGDKLAKMLEAEMTINAGKYLQPVGRDGEPVCKMKGFTKAEKSFWFSMVDDIKIPKKYVKPRFICCPPPEFLFTVGPYTHAQTKWLSATYGPTDHLFYAGCATPNELNHWLNFVHSQLGVYVSIADDISACDASHSQQSMRFHKRARARLFGRLPDDIELHYDAEENLYIKVGEYRMKVKYVNGSGVSDTSFKNSLLCLFIRLFAIAHAVRDLTELPPTELLAWLSFVRARVYTAASGDDGMIRCPRIIAGVDVTSAEAITRYNDMWALFGFSVKVQVFEETNWRMATFLASRPTWTGEFYEFTPEPARRMRSLFWQIDNSMHPMVWGRSVATSLWAAAAANPVLGPLALWYLEHTTGSVVEATLFDNPYNPFAAYETVGREVVPRAIEEFLIDYQLTGRDYDVYLGMLKNTPSVFVSMNCHLVRQLFRLEC